MIGKFGFIAYKPLKGSYLPSNRNLPESEWVENTPWAILIFTEKFNSILVLGVNSR